MNMATFENNPVIEFVAHFVPPLQGLNLNAMIPRALPWAILCCAFSAWGGWLAHSLAGLRTAWQPAAACFFAPKALNKIAQGNALGSRPPFRSSPERAAQFGKTLQPALF
jgi:hypothetical protein